MRFIDKIVVDYLRQGGIHTVSSTGNSSSLETSSRGSEDHDSLSDDARDKSAAFSRRGAKRANNPIKTRNLFNETNIYARNNSKDSLESTANHNSANDEREEYTSDSTQDAHQPQKRRFSYSLSWRHLHEHDLEQHQRMLDNNESEERHKRKREDTAFISVNRHKNSHEIQDCNFTSRRRSNSQEYLSSESRVSEPGDSSGTSSSSDSENRNGATGSSLSESHYSSPSHADTSDSSSSGSLSTQRKAHTITDASIGTSSGSENKAHNVSICLQEMLHGHLYNI